MEQQLKDLNKCISQLHYVSLDMRSSRDLRLNMNENQNTIEHKLKSIEEEIGFIRELMNR